MHGLQFSYESCAKAQRSKTQEAIPRQSVEASSPRRCSVAGLVLQLVSGSQLPGQRPFVTETRRSRKDSLYLLLGHCTEGTMSSKPLAHTPGFLLAQ